MGSILALNHTFFCVSKGRCETKAFFVSFFCLVFFRHYAIFFRKFLDSIKGYPLAFFCSFRFVKTFYEPELPLFEFFDIVRLEKILFSKKISRTIFLKKIIFCKCFQ